MTEKDAFYERRHGCHQQPTNGPLKDPIRRTPGKTSSTGRQMDEMVHPRTQFDGPPGKRHLQVGKGTRSSPRTQFDGPPGKRTECQSHDPV